MTADIQYVFTDDDQENKPVKEKNKGGRPKGKRYEKPTKKDKMNFKKLHTLYSYGMIDEEVAEVFNISIDALNRWKKDKDFYEAMCAGKALPDQQVARSLYHRAIGYDCEETDIKVIAGEVVKTKVTKHYPPDTTAASLWLRNRRPDLWRDKQDVEVTGKGGGPVTLEIVYEKKNMPEEPKE